LSAPTFARINDFNLHVATVNGSGSQTANATLLRAIFQMGVPVSGKNLFPSNIAGLPTWFTIRVNERGHLARRRDNDLLVAMNPETAAADVAAMGPGSVTVVNDGIALPDVPSDRTVHVVPFTKLVAPLVPDAKLRRLVVNMVYVGVVAHLVGIDPAEVDRALASQLGRKQKALAMNREAVKAGLEYARQHLPAAPVGVERRSLTEGKILIEGNTAAALGAMFGGVTFVSWYPITPSSSLAEALQGYLDRYRRDPESGEATYAILQAEDEIAAIGMVLGASWAGARSMTATSGPGLSLMTEFVGYAYYAEIPAVIWDIQRIGPSTGLPTRTSQGDLLSAAFMSHGDTKHVLLFPASVDDCYRFGMEAFDLAERLQTPVFVMSDLDLGMNTCTVRRSGPRRMARTMDPRHAVGIGWGRLEKAGEGMGRWTPVGSDLPSPPPTFPVLPRPFPHHLLIRPIRDVVSDSAAAPRCTTSFVLAAP
jgi:2-oxoglutarate ferredoxin oxidoreductase subunit alpha